MPAYLRIIFSAALLRWPATAIVVPRAARDPVATTLPLPRPSPSKPLIFFHIPKCAGSTLESFFSRSALRANLSFVDPCPMSGQTNGYSEDVFPCGFGTHDEDTCGTPKGKSTKELQASFREALSCSSVIAGHFFPWRTLPQLACVQQFVHQRRGQCADAAAEKEYCNCHVQGNPSVDMSCVVSLREPLARLMSDIYHNEYPDKCKAWQCRKFSDLNISMQLDIVDGKGSNTHLAWLLGPHVVHRAHTEKKTIRYLVQAGMAVLNRCTTSIADRWQDTAALFRAAMPWADDLLHSESLAPGIHGGTSLAPSSETGLEKEFAMLQASLPALCQRIAPDVFFYLAAMELFEKQLDQFNVPPAGRKKQHFCLPIFEQLGINIDSTLSDDMMAHFLFPYLQALL